MEANLDMMQVVSRQEHEVAMAETDDVLTHLNTVRDFVRWGASRMSAAGLHFGHGTSNAIDESAALVLHGIHLQPDLHPEYFDAALTPDEKRTVLDLLDRRMTERKPAAYLTNRAWFMGLPFYVDERVLVPRSPMAELIESQFAPWSVDADAVHRILDLCTGSGCIGIACGYTFPNATVDLSDISDDALAVAGRNIAEHGLGERVQIIQSDLFDGLENRRYDLIVSNPPYVGVADLATLPEEYRHEPVLGLISGEHGLDAVTRILREAPRYLTADGVLVVEVGATHDLLSKVYPEAPFVWLELERGGEGVFLLTAEQLRDCGDMFSR